MPMIARTEPMLVPSRAQANDDGRLAASTWKVVLAVTGLAAVLRVLFYPGYFGSDEVTYVESAFKLLQGDWSVESYVGANRYGVNLPIAAFGWLFGQNEFAAALYSMLCSLAEVALVTGFGIRMFGLRAGLMAGLLLATLPLHAHYAGRLMADSPLCLAITASFLLFWLGEARNSRWAYLAAGCAAGFTFWIKPAAVFYLLVLALYPLVFLRFNLRWVWTVLGFAAAVAANNLLFWLLTDNAWYLFEAMTERSASGYLETGISGGSITDGPGVYLLYLFVKIYHTWLLGYLALAVLVRWLVRGRRPDTGHALHYTLWWAIGLIATMSLLIVSWQPLVFVPKQVNYMLMFVAPLCLLGGVALARLHGAGFVAACMGIFVPALLFGLLEQTTVQVFTSNSKAAVQFASTRPDAQVFAMTNAYRAAQFDALVNPEARRPDLQPLERLQAPAASVQPRLAIIDAETLGWSGSDQIRRIDEVPTCWKEVARLQPAGLGPGSALARAAMQTMPALPASVRAAVQARLESLAAPKPAVVYAVPAEPCEAKAAPARPSSRP